MEITSAEFVISNTDVKKTAIMFRQMFLGLSYEQAFLNGLNVDELAENFHYIYSLLKAWYSFVFFNLYYFWTHV